MHFRLVSLCVLFFAQAALASSLTGHVAVDRLASLVQESKEAEVPIDQNSGVRLELIVTDGPVPQELSYSIRPEREIPTESAEGPRGIVPGIYQLIVQSKSQEVFKQSFLAAADVVSDLKLSYSGQKGFSLRQTVALPQIAFKPNQKQLHRKSKMNVREVAEFLKAHDAIETLGIEVHTDTGGNEQSNLELTTFRAIEIRNALLKLGVDAQRIKTFGLGSARPAVPNDTAENRKLNRRVEYIVLETSTKPRLLGER